MEKIVCIVILILYGVIMLLMCYIAIFQKEKKPKNNVRFYVARDKDSTLWLYLGKPERQQGAFVNSYSTCVSFMISEYNFKNFGLNENDYKDLKWEDEPLEVFVNMED